MCKHVCECLIAVMGLLIWPCLSYHNVINRLYHYIDLVVSHFEQKLYIKRKRRPHKGLLNWMSAVSPPNLHLVLSEQ